MDQPETPPLPVAERVCPLPQEWNRIYEALTAESAKHLDWPEPPVPLILGAWPYTSDYAKAERWRETVA